ncbi:MAG: zinc ribbon domain-containing protein [Clostridia bacterium]|nr:zinc ribbon domain-containing protein [Clostridia bacterium]
MNCKFCGTENYDEATFCRKCGKRLDGLIICPECGRENPDDSIFCSYCGTRLTDIKICEECGTAYEGDFCPVCNASDDDVERAANIDDGLDEDLFEDETPETEGSNFGALAYADATENAHAGATVGGATVAEDDKKNGWKKWVLLAGSIVGLLGVLLTVLFSFLVTVTPYGAYKELSAYPEYYSHYGSYTVSLKWLFGDAWDVLKEKTDAIDAIPSLAALNFVDGYKLAYDVEAYVPLLFTFVIFISTIITVLVHAIIAIVRYVGELRGKPNKGVLKPTLSAFFTYILGACLIRSMWASSTKMSVMGVSESAGYHFGGATVAGIALTSVFLALFLGSRIAVNYKSVLKVRNLVSLSACALAIVFVSVIWSQATGAVVGAKVSISGYKASSKYSMLQVLQMLGLSNFEAHMAPDGDVHGYTLLAVMCIFSIVAVSLVSSASMQSLTKHLNNAVSEEKKSTLSEAIVLTIFSVIFLVVAVVIVNEVFKIMGTEDAEGTKKIYGAAVVVLVFAVLNLGVSIADIVLRNKFADKELI